MAQGTLSARVAANVRAELARAGYSQAKLAQALDTTQQTISRRMSGQVAFTIEELGSIANILGVPLIALIGQEVAA